MNTICKERWGLYRLAKCAFQIFEYSYCQLWILLDLKVELIVYFATLAYEYEKFWPHNAVNKCNIKKQKQKKYHAI